MIKAWETLFKRLTNNNNNNLCTTQTFKVSFVFFCPDSSHVELLSSRLRQHPLQPLQRGLALLREGRQALLAGVERRHVAMTVF